MLNGAVFMALPKEGLLVQGQGEFTGEVSLCTPVIGFSLCVLLPAMSNIAMRRLMRNVLPALNDAVEATHFLGVMGNHYLDHDLANLRQLLP